MRAAILEIRDGVATGPLHQPVPRVGRNTRFDDEAFDWPTLCGVRGHAYQREALAALGHTSECFECAVAKLKPPPPKRPIYNPGPQPNGTASYATAEERSAARKATYRSYYQRAAGPRRTCGCGNPKSKRAGVCRPCYVAARRAA